MLTIEPNLDTHSRSQVAPLMRILSKPKYEAAIARPERIAWWKQARYGMFTEPDHKRFRTTPSLELA